MIKEAQITTHNRFVVASLRFKDAFADMVGWCLEKLGAPAMLKEFEFVDPESNETI
jgi:hypothetical protein